MTTVAPAVGGGAQAGTHFVGPWLVLAAVFAGAFTVALGPITDGDIFWHLAAGREMVRRHDWLRADPFTVSAGGRPWPDVHWLFQLGAYGIHQTFGLMGLVIVKAAIVAVGAVVLTRTVGRATGRVGLSLCAVGLVGALFVARHALLLRPVIVTLLMLALFFATLEGCRVGSARRLYLLPVLQVVWANCQGLSALGPSLIAAYLLAGVASAHAPPGRWPFARERHLPRRTLAITLGLSIAALFATPYGLAGATLPGRLLLRLAPVAGNVFSAAVAENVPPLMLQRTAPDQVAHFGWYLAAVALCLLVARRRLRLSRSLVLLGFGALALMANRNVLLFYWLATPLAVMTVVPAARLLLGRLSRTGFRFSAMAAVPRVALAVALGGELALAGIAGAAETPLGEPAPFHFPLRSVRHLKALAASGPVFAPDHHGGYLAFAAPALAPYIDTRLMLHTAEEYAAYLRAVDQPAFFDVLDEAVHFRYVVLTTSYPDRYLALAQHLAASAGWHLVDTDGSEMLFTRHGPAMALGERATTQAILGDLAARFARAPRVHETARLNLARLLVVLERTDEAQHVLSTLNTAAAVQLRARAHFVAGELAAAETLSRALVDADQHDVRSLALLAQIAFVGGHSGPGVGWLRRALDVDPNDSEARALLIRIETAAGDSQEMAPASVKATGS